MWALVGRKLGGWLPKAGVGGLNRPLLGRPDLRTKRLDQASAVGSHHPPPSAHFTGVYDPRGIQSRGNIQVCASRVPGLSCLLSYCPRGQQTPVPATDRGSDENHPMLQPPVCDFHETCPRNPLPLSAIPSPSRVSPWPYGPRTCRKEQVVPIVTSRVTLPRRSCTFPDLRMSSLPTWPSVRSAKVQVFSASLASCGEKQGMETRQGVRHFTFCERTPILSPKEAWAAGVRTSFPEMAFLLGLSATGYKTKPTTNKWAKY